MKKKRRTLTRWIHEVLTVDSDCSSISLFHLKDGKAVRVHSVGLHARQWVPAELAKMFHRKGQADANSKAGVQRYVLRTFCGSTPLELDYPMDKVPAALAEHDVMARARSEIQRFQESNLSASDARRVLAATRRLLANADTRDIEDDAG